MYKNKYTKYKLKMIGSAQNKNFYFVHNTFGYDNLIEILKCGVLKIGAELSEEQRRLSGGIPKNYIYMSIFFEDIKEQYIPCGLVFSSNILDDYDIVVNVGWNGNELCSISHKDTKKDKMKKIKKIKNFIKNPEKILPPQRAKMLKNNIMLHEVLFDKNIFLDKYLVKINDCGFTDKQIKEIKKIVCEKKLNVVV